MITANDIRTCVFSRAGRGYKIQDVDDFLEEAADSMEKLQNENEDLLRKLEVLADRIQEYRNDEDSIHSALLTAQKSADTVLKEANVQKEEIIADARQQAEDMLRLSQDKSIAIATETKEKATMVLTEAKEKASRLLLEAKTKSEDMLSEAVEGCKAEKKYLDFLKEQEKFFRQEIVEMYKKQFELLKRGPEIVKELEEALAKETEPVTLEEPVIVAQPIEETVSVEKDPVSADVEETTEEPEQQVQENYVDPEDVPLPVATISEDNFTVKPVGDTAEEDVLDEQPVINDGFSVKNKFGDLKFGDDYDISADDDYDEV
ncbi:MAG: DivIVA domain-containing protein [Clostridia bacterium]|nr:DivIVA domain-containing protein [Clostridia bacterium]